ncbi:MAG TPA: extracellular solute-binding protein [Firmicutes bacterium]|nr:extracellular solute-binding protein [Bacillota bacterium]
MKEEELVMWRSRKRVCRIALNVCLLGLSLLLLAGLQVSAASGKQVVLHQITSTGAHGRMMSYIVELFEEKTGIKVELEPLPNDPRRTKIVNDLVSGAGQNDLVLMDGKSWGDVIWPYLVDLEPFMNRDKYNPYEDLIKPVVDVGRFGPKQHLFALPYRYSGWIIYYRKDLFSKHGVQLPKTWEDYYQAAKKLTIDSNGDGKPEIYGTAISGKQGVYSMNDIESWITGHGGGIFAPDYSRVTITDKPAIKAIERWLGVYRNGWTPPGSNTYVDESRITAMQQGRIAFWSCWGIYPQLMLDPKQSRVYDKVDLALIPSPDDSSERYIPISGWSMGISKYSKHKDEAWEFIKFITSPDIQQKVAVMKDFGNGPVRLSTYKDPQVKESIPRSDVMLESLLSGKARPGYVGYFADVEETVSAGLSGALVKNTKASEVAATIAKGLQSILKNKIQPTLESQGK